MAATMSGMSLETAAADLVSLVETNKDFIFTCYQVSLSTIALLVVLEFFTWDKEWSKKVQDPEIWALYKEALWRNVEHTAVLGPMAYASASMFIDYYGSTPYWYISFPCMFLIQAVGYALCHAWMHKPHNYWIHRFHHRYSEKTFVRPIAANTVTHVEFTIAYMLPIVTAILICRPTKTGMYWFSMTISITNLMIHTSKDFLPMDKYWPSFLVTNTKHFYHHGKNVRRNYSASLIDLDGVLGLKPKALDSKKE